MCSNSRHKRKFVTRSLFSVPVFLLAFTLTALLHGQGRPASKKEQGGAIMEHKAATGMITSEQAFLREMIRHHQEAIDTSILLSASTGDTGLKKTAETIYKARSREMLEMKLYYAKLYNTIPESTAYQATIKDLDRFEGRERDIHYVLHMTVHHKAAVRMAKKALDIQGIQKETIEFAKHIISSQSYEIELLQNWLRMVGALR